MCVHVCMYTCVYICVSNTTYFNIHTCTLYASHTLSPPTCYIVHEPSRRAQAGPPVQW